MALSNYTELQAAIASYMQRSDLTTPIVDFIALCEKKINRYLRTLEIELSVTISPMAETNTLPTDFLELRTVVLTSGSTKWIPRFVLPDFIDNLKTTTPTATGLPEYFTIRLGKTEYYPAPSGTISETLVYYQRIVPLATTATNWLLTNHPDIYLYGSLSEASAYVQDDARIGLWKSAYAECINDLTRMDDRKRFVKGSMSVDLGLPGGGRPSIETGF